MHLKTQSMKKRERKRPRSKGSKGKTNVKSVESVEDDKKPKESSMAKKRKTQSSAKYKRKKMSKDSTGARRSRSMSKSTLSSPDARKKTEKPVLERIPSTGLELLEWVRLRMSFESYDSETSEGSIERIEVEIGEEPKAVTDKKVASRKRPSKMRRKGKKRKAKDKKVDIKEEIEVSQLLEDEIMMLYRIRKEQQKSAELLKKQEERKIFEILGDGSKKKRKKGKKGKKRKKVKTGKKVKKGKKRKNKRKKKGKKKKDVRKGGKKKVPLNAMIQQRLKDKQLALEEEEKQKAEKIRLEEEGRILAETDRREIAQHYFQIEQLRASLEMQKIIQDYNIGIREREFSKLKWKLYLECDSLPIATRVNEMSTYLNGWAEVIEGTTPEEAAKRSDDALKLLASLDDVIDNAEPETLQLPNWKWARSLFRDYQARSLERTSYNILRDIERKMNRIGIPNAEFNYKTGCFTIHLWLKIQLPIPLDNFRRPPPPRIELEFPKLGIGLRFPADIDGKYMAIRGMYHPYNHLSDTTRSHNKPPKPDYYKQDLLETAQLDWKVKLKYRYESSFRIAYLEEQNARVKKIQDQNETQLQAQQARQKKPAKPVKMPKINVAGLMPPFVLPQVELTDFIPIVPFQKLNPTPEEYAEFAEELKYERCRGLMTYECDEGEVNLRKYIVIGGVFHIDLYFQPPQPQPLVSMEMEITALILPKDMKKVPFDRCYVDPITIEDVAPDFERSQEEEQLIQEQIQEEMKARYDSLGNLIFVTIVLPSHVLYLEPPIVCLWDHDRKQWNTSSIHELQHDTENRCVSFYTGLLGCFGLAAQKYSNMPYKGWDMKPEVDGSVTFNLIGAVVGVTLNINEVAIKVIALKSTTIKTEMLTHIISQTFNLQKLINVLQTAGIDVFPEYDAFCYINGLCEKHWPMVLLLYYNMAQIAISYNFAWSKFNTTTGRRSVVMQMREYQPGSVTQKPMSMVHITPAKAEFVNCTESSEKFNPEPFETQYNPNLWYLMKSTSTASTRKQVQAFSMITCYTIAKLLSASRIMSFS